MIRLEDFMQLKAFARVDALMLTLLWTASFACVVMFPAAGLLGNLLAMATPFFVGWRTAIFRDRVLGGTMSMRRAYAYSLYNFLYASLAFALVQFAYFRFMDNGTFGQIINETIRALAPIYEQNGMSKTEITNTMNSVSMLSPIQWAFMFMMQNMMIGAVASLPIAAVCRRHGGMGHKAA